MIRLIIKVELKKAARSLKDKVRESFRAERELASLSTLRSTFGRSILGALDLGRLTLQELSSAARHCL